MNTVYSVCLDEKNINVLIDSIRSNIKLTDKSVPKCTAMIVDIMKKNIKKLSRSPRDREELKNVVRHLNKLCVSHIVETIAKKYPELYINHNKQVSKEQMRREIETHGRRENYVPTRPCSQSKMTSKIEDTYTLVPNDVGIKGGELSNYASAFCDQTITGEQFPKNTSNKSTDRSMQLSSTFEQKYQNMINDRNNNFSTRQKPETPDFTLDGSGEKVRREKLLRKVADGNSQSMNPPDLISGFVGDDPYSSLLIGGSPFDMQMNNMSFNSNMPHNDMSFNNTGQYQSSNNWQGNDPGKQSTKSTQLQNDYERMIAERNAVDAETGQPTASTKNTFNPGGMNNIPNQNTFPNISLPDLNNYNNYYMSNQGHPNPNNLNNYNMANQGGPPDLNNYNMPNQGGQSNFNNYNMPNINYNMPNQGGLSNLNNYNMPNQGVPTINNSTNVTSQYSLNLEKYSSTYNPGGQYNFNDIPNNPQR